VIVNNSNKLMALYEAVIIARQDLSGEDVDNLIKKLSKIITDASGKIVNTEYWGLRNLPIKIKKNNRAHYYFLNIDADKSVVAEFKRVIGYTEDVIRSSIFVVDEHKVQTSLLISANAKNANNSVQTKKTAGVYDLVLEQIQFDS